MEPIQDDIEKGRKHGKVSQRMADLEAQNAALRFSVREWKDKAQDKIAECDRLVAERDDLRDELKRRVTASADRVQMDGERIEELVAERDRLIQQRDMLAKENDHLRALTKTTEEEVTP